MRKALFAIMLVAASFAGGAVVNGPGLRWAQAVVLSRLVGDGEAGDDGVPATPSGANGPAPAPAPAEEIPARPIPPLVVPSLAQDKEKAGPDDAVYRAVAEQRPRAGRPATDSTSATPKAPAPDEPAPAPAPAFEGVSMKLDDVPTLERPPGPAPAPLPERAGDETPPVVQDAGKGKEEGAHDTPADTPVRRASLADTAAPAGEWADVRAAMRALGVSRYGIEGEPAGRVRFHCVIPLAGRRAVGQHFEAEGDDDLQAARAALKRVALWKATEAGAAAP